MDTCADRKDCTSCTAQYICRCLKVTEEELLTALATREIHSLRDLRAQTGAGDGCTACRKTLARYLELQMV
jgi:bacterioferritin-associated ferredoxin